MAGAPHRIRRQRWAVRASSAESAFRIRKQLREDWQDLFLPVFEKTFDQVVQDDEIVRIPRIELRLAIDSENALTATLPDLIYSRLSEHLRDLLSKRSGSRQTASARASSNELSEWEVLLHYLRRGSVQWDAADRAEVLEARLKEVCLERRGELAAVVRSGQTPWQFIFRLLQLLPASGAGDLVIAALEGVAESWTEPLQQVLRLLLRAVERQLHEHQTLELAARFLREAVVSRTSGTAPQFMPIARSILPAEALERLVQSLPAELAALFHIAGSVDRQDAGAVADSFSPPLTRQMKGVRTSPPSAPEFTAGKNVVLFPPEKGAHGSHDKFPLTVTHAGLILLHPFLPRFLDAAGVVEVPPGRITIHHSARAAALLYFLATGREEIYEFDLGFIKVLLGCDPDSPLCAAAGLLRESDKLEAEALLEATIAHWPALGKTSLKGFRASFLNRHALLSEDESGWKLQVERLSFDVLLDGLPWAIGVVKLPWIARPIYTEW